MENSIYELVSVHEQEDFKVIIKKKEYDSKEGVELLTGTKCLYTFFDLKPYLYYNPLKKGTMIVKFAACLSEEEVLKRLESLTREDIVEYKRKIREAKEIQQSINLEVEKETERNIKCEKQREYKLKSIIRKARHM